MGQLEVLKQYKEKFNEYAKTAEQAQFVRLMIVDMMLQKSIKDAEGGKFLDEKNFNSLKSSMKKVCGIEEIK